MTVEHFKNRHMGQTCIVVGNGPSLRYVLDQHRRFLDKYPTFGANEIFLEFIPTYYVAVNKLVIEQNRAAIKMLPCEKFLPVGMGFECHGLNIMAKKEFSRHANNWIYEGYTVTFVSLQLAYYMGFSTVLLVGLDHRYKYDGQPNAVGQIVGEDVNHFSPDYFKNKIWNNPDLKQSEISYMLADEAYIKDNRRILNLTEGSACTVFEFDGLERWL